VLNDLGHGEGLAGPSNSQQHLVPLPGSQPLDQLLNGPRLIATRFVACHQLKVHAGIIREERRLGEENCSRLREERGEKVVLKPECKLLCAYGSNPTKNRGFVVL
jgi:hypothetical protein